MLKSVPAQRGRVRGSDPPDLHTQFESMLDQVWRSEAEWRLFDRIDAFCGAEPDRCGDRAIRAGNSGGAR